MTMQRWWRLAAAMLIAALVSGAAFAGLGRPAAAAGDCVADATWGARNSDFEARVVTLVNQHRQGRGLVPVTVSTTLRAAAGWKALHMANYSYMQHDDPAPPVARTTAQRLQACGYPTSQAGWGENIAYGYSSPEAVMQAWLNSPGHRANIENASYRAIGVGAAVKGSGPVYWAQDFGTLVDSPASGTPAPTASATATATRTPSATATATATATTTSTPIAVPTVTRPTFPWQTTGWRWW